MDGRQIMTADEVRRAIIRISHELVEKQAGTEGLVLIGIQRRGVPLAKRVADAILKPRRNRVSNSVRGNIAEISAANCGPPRSR